MLVANELFGDYILDFKYIFWCSKIQWKGAAKPWNLIGAAFYVDQSTIQWSIVKFENGRHPERISKEDFILFKTG